MRLMHRLTPFVLLAGWLSLPACQSYPLNYVGGNDPTVVVGTQTLSSSNVDILFVVDNSGSMADKQATLRASSSAFVEELAKTNVNYHLGLVTTDLYSPTDGGRLRMAQAGSVYLTAPRADDADAPAKRQALVKAFNDTVAQLGIAGNSQEAGLGAALRALAPADVQVRNRNQGFLRPTADLAVIIVTDEDDCTPLPQNYATVANAGGQPTLCYDSPALLTQTKNLLSQFAALKGGDIGRVRMALITGGKKDTDGTFVPMGCNTGANGQPDTTCGCWYYAAEAWFCTDLSAAFGQPCTSIGTCPAESCPSNALSGVCDSDRCKTTSPHRYVDFLAQLTASRQAVGQPAGTFVDTICQSDYRSTLLSVARSVVVNNCLTLGSDVDADNLALSLARVQTDGSFAPPQALRRFGAADPAATCRRCEDCADNAWELLRGAAGERQMCFACGLQAQPGDRLKVSVVAPGAGG